MRIIVTRTQVYETDLSTLNVFVDAFTDHVLNEQDVEQALDTETSFTPREFVELRFAVDPIAPVIKDKQTLQQLVDVKRAKEESK